MRTEKSLIHIDINSAFCKEKKKKENMPFFTVVNYKLCSYGDEQHSPVCCSHVNLEELQ